MKRALICWILLCLSAVAQTTGGSSSEALPAVEQPPSAKMGVLVYPRNNQSLVQQQKDEAECYDLAKQQTAINPDAPPPAAQDRAMAGNSEKEAAEATERALRRGRQLHQDSDQQTEQQATQQQQGMETFQKAFSSCIDARGYSVR